MKQTCFFLEMFGWWWCSLNGLKPSGSTNWVCFSNSGGYFSHQLIGWLYHIPPKRSSILGLLFTINAMIMGISGAFTPPNVGNWLINPPLNSWGVVINLFQLIMKRFFMCNWFFIAKCIGHYVLDFVLANVLLAAGCLLLLLSMPEFEVSKGKKT